MSKNHHRYSAYMFKDKVEVRRHLCFLESDVMWERVTKGVLKGLTSPITGTCTSSEEAVKQLMTYLKKKRNSVLGELGRLNRQIPACEHYLIGKEERC